MRKLLFSILLLPSMAFAQNPVVSNKEVVCDKVEIIMSALVKEYEEKPFWLGKDAETKSSYALLANSKNGSWTIVQFNEQIACILGAGTGHTPLQSTSKSLMVKM